MHTLLTFALITTLVFAPFVAPGHAQEKREGLAPQVLGDPIPGIDVALEQIPGGKVERVKTDANGNYVFDRLAPGSYTLRLGAISPQKVENHNSSRFNKSSIVRPGGTEEHRVDIEVSRKVIPGLDPGTKITLRQHGQLLGRVTMVRIVRGIEVWNLPAIQATPTKGGAFFVRGRVISRPTAGPAGKEQVKGPNAVNVKLAVRDPSSKAIIASITPDKAGNFEFARSDGKKHFEFVYEIAHVLQQRQTIKLCPLPPDPGPTIELIKCEDPGGPVLRIAIWTCYNPPCPWETDEPLVNRIFDALDRLVQSSGSDDAARERLKLEMKKTGASDDQIRKILSEVGIKEEGVK